MSEKTFLIGIPSDQPSPITCNGSLNTSKYGSIDGSTISSCDTNITIKDEFDDNNSIENISNNSSNNSNDNNSYDVDGSWESIMCYLISMNSSSFFNYIVNGALTILVPLFVADVLHESKSFMGFIFFLNYLADIICIPFAGLTSGKYGSIVSLIIVAIMKAVGYGILFLSIYFKFEELICIIVCSIILGASEAFYSVGYMSFTSKYIYNDKRGRFNTYVSTLKRLGFLIGTFCTGYVIQYGNIQSTLFLLTVLSIISIFCIILLLTPPKYSIDNEYSFNGSIHSFRYSYSTRKIRLERLMLGSWVSPKNIILPNNTTKRRVRIYIYI